MVKTEKADRSKTKSRQNAWEKGGNWLRNVVNALRRPTICWNMGREERGWRKVFQYGKVSRKKKIC